MMVFFFRCFLINAFRTFTYVDRSLRLCRGVFLFTGVGVGVRVGRVGRAGWNGGSGAAANSRATSCGAMSARIRAMKRKVSESDELDIVSCVLLRIQHRAER